MRKFLIGSVLMAGLVAVPMAAQTSDQPATTTEYRENDDSGKWGLAGLLGLLGLMGLRKKDEVVHKTTLREGAANAR